MVRPSLDELFSFGTDALKKKRNRLIHLAHDRRGCTLKEIAQALGGHYTTISKVINRSRH
jgi:IS30 family transposase